HSNLLRSEDALLSGHLVLAPIQDNVDDGGFRAAMQPDVVSEVRRTQSGIAFALGTMTGHAVRVVAAFAWHDPQGVGSQAGQRPDILRNVGCLGGADRAAPRRHDTMTAFGD